jgi:hypothetical protein
MCEEALIARFAELCKHGGASDWSACLTVDQMAARSLCSVEARGRKCLVASSMAASLSAHSLYGPWKLHGPHKAAGVRMVKLEGCCGAFGVAVVATGGAGLAGPGRSGGNTSSIGCRGEEC